MIASGSRGRRTEDKGLRGALAPLFFILMVFFAASSCTTATIRMKDGRVAYARIAGSERGKILATSKHGQEMILDREEIEDIDHPGNVLAALMTPVATVGLGVFLAGVAEYGICKSGTFKTDECVRFLEDISIAGSGMVVATAPFAVWGWVDWGLSRSRGAPPPHSARTEGAEDRTMRWTVRFLGIVPMIDGGSRTKGLTAALQF